jgi:glycosyltransferase involved in cell wall biosynthesis
MRHEKPKVSVIIPSYNRADVLSRALKSVFAQTYRDFEIIVVDDCSKDNILEVVTNFNDSRIRYIKHEQNQGGGASRNTGIKEAKGEFVAFLDSDDEWLPTKLEKQLALFVNLDMGLVYCGFNLVEPGIKNGLRPFVSCGENFRQDLLVSNFVGTTSVAIIRKHLLEQIKGFDVVLRSCQDWDLYIRLSEICKFACVDEYLVLYHIDFKVKNQITTNPTAIIAGHAIIQQKYAQKINELPTDKKVQRIDYLLTIYCCASSFKGIPLAFQGLLMSGDLKYILWFVKILAKKLLRALRIR